MLTLTVMELFVIMGCLIASVFFVLSFYKMYRKPFLRSTFGIICLVDMVMQILLIWPFSISFIFRFEESFHFILSICGHFCFFCIGVMFFIQILKALNCFCAIIFYWKYSTLFSIKNTVFYISFIMLINFLITFPYFLEDCHLQYLPEVYYWNLMTKKCMAFFVVNTHISYILPIAVILNILSSSYLYFKRKNISQQQKLTKVEKNFLVQASLTSFVITFVLLCIYFIQVFFTSTELTKFLLGCSGTIIYCTLNEIIIFIFLKDIKTTTSKNNSSQKQLKTARIEPKIPAVS